MDMEAGKTLTNEEVIRELLELLKKNAIRTCEKVFTKQQSIWKHFSEICF